jgi:hypothetical protein
MTATKVKLSTCEDGPENAGTDSVQNWACERDIDHMTEVRISGPMRAEQGGAAVGP